MLELGYLPTYLSPPAFTSPAAPATFSTTRPAFGGTTRVCTTAAELTTALSACVDGDIIALQPGTNFDGQFTFRNRSTSGWVEIRTNISTATLDAACPPGTRMTPAKAASLNLATLRATATNGLVSCDLSAVGYRVTAVACTIAPGTASTTGLLRLGNSSLTLTSQAGSDMIVDRCWLYGVGQAKNTLRGVALCGPRMAVIDSYLEQFYHDTTDSQAVAVFCYQGPYLVQNNYMEAWGETFMAGGAWWSAIGAGTVSCAAGTATFSTGQGTSLSVGSVISLSGGPQYTVSAYSSAAPTTATLAGSPTFGAQVFWIGGDGTDINAVVSDLIVRGNYMTRRTADWSLTTYGKNGFELKTCIRGLIENNIIENVAQLQQQGYVNFKSAGDETSANVTKDIEFRNNWIRSCANGFQVSASPGGSGSTPTAHLANRIYVHDNLFEHINDTTPWTEQASQPGSCGTALFLGGSLADVTIEHNTWVKVMNTGQPGVAVSNDSAFGGVGTAIGMVCVRNNLLQYGGSGVKQSGVAEGSTSWDGYVSGNGLWDKNVLVGLSSLTGYPSGTLAVASDAGVGFTDLVGGSAGYLLAVSSPYKGQATDRADIGITDVAAFFVNLVGVAPAVANVATQLLVVLHVVRPPTVQRPPVTTLVP